MIEHLPPEPLGWQSGALGERMTTNDDQDYLHAAARELEARGEWDSAYGIYREMVWRFPSSGMAWDGLARAARHLGREDEAARASARALQLS